MNPTIKHLPFIAASSFFALGIAFGPKSYPVTHTEAEWVQQINGLVQVRDVIHQSNIPANMAFWCDSALTAQQNDIYRQVIALKVADTTKKAIKP